MPLRHAADTAAAGWISGWSFEELVTFGGSGFEAYVRSRFVPTRRGTDDASPGGLPPDHLSDLEQARRALDLLARHPGTPDRCYFCIWDGYGDLSLDAIPGERTILELPHRGCTFMGGPLDALRTWETDPGRRTPLEPRPPSGRLTTAGASSAMSTPLGRHGASAEAICELLDDPTLDIVAADPRQPQPYCYREHAGRPSEPSG